MIRSSELLVRIFRQWPSGEVSHLGGRHMAEDIAVEMHHAALSAGLGKIVDDALDQAPASVEDDQSDSAEAPIGKMTQ